MTAMCKINCSNGNRLLYVTTCSFQGTQHTYIHTTYIHPKYIHTTYIHTYIHTYINSFIRGKLDDHNKTKASAEITTNESIREPRSKVRNTNKFEINEIYIHRPLHLKQTAADIKQMLRVGMSDKHTNVSPNSRFGDEPNVCQTQKPKVDMSGKHTNVRETYECQPEQN